MESKLQKPTVTIGISAHNEERNIGSLLESLLKQNMDAYSLDAIVVLCDGCTDNTVLIVESFLKKYTNIKMINDNIRMGKIGRLNWLCKNTQSDFLVIFDADTRISDTEIIEKLIESFVSKDIGLVAGLQKPELPRNLIETIFVTWEMIWIEIRKNLNNGVSVHNISGCNFAMSKMFYENLIIPKEIIAEDEFLFFEVYKRNMKFVFVPEVIVYYRLPARIKEYFIQSARFMGTKYKIQDYFKQANGHDYKIPIKNKIKAIGKIFMHKPLSTCMALLLQVFVRLYIIIFPARYNNNIWNIAESTK